MSALHAPPVATPDFEALKRCLLRQQRPERVHFVEMFLDGPIKLALYERFGLTAASATQSPLEEAHRDIQIMQRLGYELVRVHAPAAEFPVDIAWDPHERRILRGDARKTIQGFTVHEHAGPIQRPEDLEWYPWPDPARIDPAPFEWAERNLPQGMAAFDLVMQVFEATTWLMGYETLFINTLEDPEFVQALVDRIGRASLEYVRFLCQFKSIGVLWGCDDMGFKSQTMVSPEWLRSTILPWHRQAARIAHEHGKLYFLHSCGNVEPLMDDLITDVAIDAKHSFEDAITPVEEFHGRWGQRVGIIGGIDVDFLARHTEEEVRRRVRSVLNRCMPGGGYALGSGNSITNYVPLQNYLAMLDEGRRWAG